MLLNNLKLMAQLALLGAIGTSILGISLVIDEKRIFMDVYHDSELSGDQLDWLEAATTEIYSHILGEFDDVRLRTHLVNGHLLPREGTYVFARLGIGWA